MCAFVCMFISVCMCTYMSLCVCVSFVYMCLFVLHVSFYICMDVCLCTCVSFCVYVCACTCLCCSCAQLLVLLPAFPTVLALGHWEPCVSSAPPLAHTPGHLFLGSSAQSVKKLAFLFIFGILVTSPNGGNGRQQVSCSFVLSQVCFLPLAPAAHLCLSLTCLTVCFPFPVVFDFLPRPSFPGSVPASLSVSLSSLCTMSLSLSLSSQPPERADSCSSGRREDRVGS